ncbi:MAG: DUF2157 domain-containing protein [Sneathiella sp.]|nr:DUF2157 domain-containing protein [Sneathiella sp.]
MIKQEANKRVRQIFAFQDEMALLQQGGIVELSAEEDVAISEYHSGVLKDFSDRFDTDLSKSENPLSWGMRIASTLGVAAFSFSVFLFFQFYWDVFSTTLQVSLVSIAPFLGWGLTELVGNRFKTNHYTTLAVFVAFACFLVNLNIVGEIYNVKPSPYAFLAWGTFGIFLSLRHDLIFVLGISIALLIIFVGGIFTTLTGYLWPNAIIQEYYLVASLLVLIVPVICKISAIQKYKYTYYFVGLLCSYFILEWAIIWSDGSLLPYSNNTIEWIYTIFAFCFASLAIWRSIQVKWIVGTYLSAPYLILFMLHKYWDRFFDEWHPYLFFLLLGGVSIAAIFIFQKMRGKLREAIQ